MTTYDTETPADLFAPACADIRGEIIKLTYRLDRLASPHSMVSSEKLRHMRHTLQALREQFRCFTIMITCDDILDRPWRPFLEAIGDVKRSLEVCQNCILDIEIEIPRDIP
jgi:hypothetical protein